MILLRNFDDSETTKFTVLSEFLEGFLLQLKGDLQILFFHFLKQDPYVLEPDVTSLHRGAIYSSL